MIRAATAGDIEAVLALWRDARSDHAVTPDDRESVERLLDHHGSVLLLSEEAGELAGAVIAAWDGWRGNVYRLAVRPERRRRGIASMLVAAAHEHLREQGCRRVTALVGAGDERAASVWRAAGYERDEQIARWVRNL